ncbi:MAG TPA: DUF1877 family protein [Actinocatenispora sp.]
MSVLGDVARVGPVELERLRSTADAYAYLSGGAVPTCDLHRYWDGLRFAMDAAGFPVNPIGGRPYPGTRSAWGHGMPHTTSCALTPDEVRQAAALLAATPFPALAAHLTGAGVADLYPANYDWRSPDTHAGAAGYYDALVGFFRDAAAAGQCTVFWAA